MNKDLTVGEPSKVLWRFCLPLFGSIIFQQLYNIADSFVAGKFIGNDALAAVGNSYEITLLFIAVSVGCNIGCSVVTAQLFGAKEYGKLRTAVWTTFISVAVLCVVLMGVGFCFSESLLRLIDTPEEVLSDSKLYLDIYILGLPFVMFYNIATGVFSALGDSRTPFIFLALSSTANIGADILFVKVFGMGVDGVAWATFICQGLSCVPAVALVLKRVAKMPVRGNTARFSFPMLGQIARVAVPSILQQSFVSVGNIFIQGLVNGFGTPVMSGYSAAVKLNNLVTTSVMTLCNGISNFASQNLGARQYDRIRQGFRAGLRIVMCIVIPIGLLYFFIGNIFVKAFLEDYTGAAMLTGVQFLKVVSAFYIVMGTKVTADAVLRGTGQMRKFMFTTFTDLALRVILAFVITKFILPEPLGIWLSWPIGWVFGTFLSVLFYRNSCFEELKATGEDFREPEPDINAE